MEHRLSPAAQEFADGRELLRDALTALLDVDLGRMDDQTVLDSMVALERINRKLFAVRVHVTAEINDRKLYRDRGSRTTGTFLRELITIGAAEANCLVRVAGATRKTRQPSGAITPPALPELTAVLDNGEICAESASIIVSAMKKLRPELDQELRDTIEAALVDQAVMTEPATVRHAAKLIEIRVDPDGTLPKEAHRRMTLTIGNRQADGLTSINGKLDDEAIERLRNCLGGLAAPRPTADGVADPRSVGERNAHAFSEMMGRFLQAAVLPRHGGVRPQVMVFMNLEDLLEGLPEIKIPAGAGTAAGTSARNAENSAGPHTGADDTPCPAADPDGIGHDGWCGCDTPTLNPGDNSAQTTTRPPITPLPTGQPPALTHTPPPNPMTRTGLASTGSRTSYGGAIHPTTARRIACDARIIPIVLGGNGQILDVGRETRSFPVPIRTAATARDQGCSFPACDIPAPWTDGHHVIPWSEGGDTSLGNAALLCGRHHTLIHNSDWTMHIADDGHPEYLPPAWMDPQRRPLRNTVHHPHQH